MLTTQLAKKYARAIFEVAVDEQKLSQFETQLAEVSAAIAGHAELLAFVNNPQIKAEAKKEIFEKLFKDSIDGYVYNFLMLLIDKHRESLLGSIAREYTVLANEAQGILEAKVTVASELSDGQKAKLIEKLQLTTGKKVVVEMKIDQSILGGMIVQIGDKRLDGSITRRMQELKTQLLAN